MGRVERETGNVIVDGDSEGQHGGQMNFAFGMVYLVDQDRNRPVYSEGRGLSVNFLAGRGWAFGHNRVGLGVPPERIIGGFGKETPNAPDRSVYGGKGTDVHAHG
jgi:hypothetical protein